MQRNSWVILMRSVRGLSCLRGVDAYASRMAAPDRQRSVQGGRRDSERKPDVTGWRRRESILGQGRDMNRDLYIDALRTTVEAGPGGRARVFVDVAGHWRARYVPPRRGSHAEPGRMVRGG